jgi:hypothetical protein
MTEFLNVAWLLLNILLMKMIPWYRVSLDIKTFPTTLDFYDYYSDGKLTGSVSNTKKIIIVEKSYIDLVTFLNDGREGWVYDLNSYAPGKLFINDTHPSAYMSVNCLDGIVVVNIKTGQKHRQFSKELTKNCPEVIIRS